MILTEAPSILKTTHTKLIRVGHQPWDPVARKFREAVYAIREGAPHQNPFHEHACEGAMSASSSNEGRWEVQTQTDRVA
jgi:hypothetical protein